MGAFNDLVIEAVCPSCGEQAVLRFQMHVAADFDGDAGGRFASRTYQLGQTLAWWPRADPRFETWKADANLAGADGRTAVEICYGGCDACDADLLADVQYEEVAPVAVHDIREEKPQANAVARSAQRGRA